MKKIETPNAPLPSGHYSQATVHNGLVFVSGQLPICPETGNKITDSIEAQAKQTIQNLEQVLIASGSGLDQVLKTTVYISDISLWGRVNKVYSEMFGEHRPARAVVPTKELHFGFQIEVEAVGVVS